MFSLIALALAAPQAPAVDSIGRRLQSVADSVVAARPRLPGVVLYVGPPGAGIAAPIAELGEFLTALVGGRVFDHQTTLDTMLVPRSPQLGGYGHSGFRGTLAATFPDDGVTIAVAVNEQSQGGAAFGILAAALRIVTD